MRREQEYPFNTRTFELPSRNGTLVQFLSRHDEKNPESDLHGAHAVLLEGGFESRSYDDEERVRGLFSDFALSPLSIKQYKLLLAAWRDAADAERPPLFFVDLPGQDVIEKDLYANATWRERYARNTILILGSIYALSSESTDQFSRRGAVTALAAFVAAPRLLGREQEDLSVCHYLVDRFSRAHDDAACIAEIDRLEKRLLEHTVILGLRNICFAYKSIRIHEYLRRSGIAHPVSHLFTGALHVAVARLLPKTPEQLLSDFRSLLTSWPDAVRYASVLLKNHAYRIPMMTSPEAVTLYEDADMKRVLEEIATMPERR